MDAARPVSARISFETMRAAASRAQPLGHEAGGDLGKAAVRGGESGSIVGARDRVPQLGRGTCAMMKQIALGDHSDRRSGGVRDA